MAALAPWKQLARHADLSAGVSAAAGAGSSGGPLSEGPSGERLARATHAMRLSDWEAAAGLLTQETAEQPGSWLALDLRALCWLEQGRHEQALSDALQCTQLKPEWARGWARLGAAQLCLGHAQAAANAYRQGLRLDPGSEEMLLGLELAQMRLLERGGRRNAAHH